MLRCQIHPLFSLYCLNCELSWFGFFGQKVKGFVLENLKSMGLLKLLSEWKFVLLVLDLFAFVTLHNLFPW